MKLLICEALLLSVSSALQQLTRSWHPLSPSRTMLSPASFNLHRFRPPMRSLYKISLLATSAPQGTIDEIDEFKKKIAAIKYCLVKLSGSTQAVPVGLEIYIAMYSSFSAEKLGDLLLLLQRNNNLLLAQRTPSIPNIPAG